MWTLVLVFMADFGNISTQQISFYQSQQECIEAAERIDIQRTEERPYTVKAECFQAEGMYE